MNVDRAKYIGGGVAVLVVVVAVLFFVRSREADPQVVLRQAVQELFTANSFTTDLVLDLKLPVTLGDQERPLRDVTVTLAGTVQRAADATPEFAGTVYMGAKGRGTILFADGDLQILREAVLFRLDNLPVLINPSGSLVDQWTLVDTSLLTTRDGAVIRDQLQTVLQSFTFAGSYEEEGEELWRYTGQLTPETEAALAEALGVSRSGNQGLHVLARLLRAFTVQEMTLVIAPHAVEVRQLELALADDVPEERARLTWQFSEYNEPVAFEAPQTELTVAPRVFADLFGSGEFTTEE